MRAVDTNVLVRVLVGDEPMQARAAAEFVASGAWVSHVVLAETVWVLESVYGVSRDRLVAALGLLLEHERIVVQDSDVVAAALQGFRSRARPGFTDCLVLEIARRAGHLPLGTFDRALGRLDGTERLPTR
jgi:predicted nucleic-acid-binding protein